MRTRSLIALFSILIFLLFAAMGCGGGGGGGEDTNPPLDTTPPVITMLGANPASVAVGAVYNDAGATAVDDVNGNVTNRITTAGLPINTSAPGSFTVVYSVSDLAGNQASATRTVNVTAVATLWKVPASYNFYSVTTDGNLVVRMGYRVIAGNPPTNLSVMVCYNSDGTTRWTKEFSYADHSTSRGVIANGNLYVLKAVGVFPSGWIVPASYDIYVDRFSLADGTAIGSSFFAGNTVDYASIAADSTGIFVSLNYENWTTDVFKLDFSLSSKSKILTFFGNIRSMTIFAGNLGLAGVMPADGSEAFVMVYTTAGTPVWANPQTYYPVTGTFSFGNAVAFSGSYVYLTGFTIVLPPVTETCPPFLRKYNAANGNFVSAVSFTAEQTANDLAVNPGDNIYVAISGAASPVALDGNGNVLWTGTAALSNTGRSLVYFQGKVITQDSVYDAVTGQRLF